MQNRFGMLKVHNSSELEKAIAERKADRKIQSFCRWINSLENYFTSSSCAGRIVLLDVESVGEKQPKAFHRKWHRKVRLVEIIEALSERTRGKELWFKLDPFILHIGARDLESARKILKAMREAGVKRGGIILAQKEKFLVELQGTNVMALPLKHEGKALVEDSYIKFVVNQANEKLEENYKRLELFEKACREWLV